MSFSALDGLPMGTRCGTLDPGVILFLLRDGWSMDRIEDLLYKRSGLLGISGVSNDVRALLASDRPLAAEAIEFFVYRLIREIGSLTAALGGLDGLVFTAGVGENSPLIREQVCQGLTWLGVRIDPDANQRGDVCISPEGCIPSVWVIPTDEEAVIASHTLAIVRLPAVRARWRTRAGWRASVDTSSRSWRASRPVRATSRCLRLAYKTRCRLRRLRYGLRFKKWRSWQEQVR